MPDGKWKMCSAPPCQAEPDLHLLDVGNKPQIDNVYRVIRLNDNHSIR
jgi:hypothetical protein